MQHLRKAVDDGRPDYREEDGLRKVVPYAYTFQTYVKQRWKGRKILEIFSTEFRDRSPAYYAFALEQGVVRVNDGVIGPDFVLVDGQLISNVIHRHEPPVAAGPIQILARDDVRGILVVVKPGSMPVHPTGRYNHNTLLHILKYEHGFEGVYTNNRLDRLTSGVMVCGMTPKAMSRLGELFGTEGAVRKYYVCRVVGCFPEEQVISEEPLLCIDRQIGISVVHPEGRPSKTIFQRLSYHAGTDTSVLHCQPVTGRSHQIRVHLQYMGFPIANDPVYNSTTAWGKGNGKGGVFIDASNLGKAPTMQTAIEQSIASHKDQQEQNGRKTKRDMPGRPPPKEGGEEPGYGSGVDLSAEARHAIITLRKHKDMDDRFARERDMTLAPSRGFVSNDNDLTKDVLHDADGPYCVRCHLPLLPDPRPDQLFIWLHALRYSSEDWDYSSELPTWAREDWQPDANTSKHVTGGSQNE
ncbi:uncharacterized protein L969DRAFT_97569 [Mixia osmundae IAM 14324]|uniref:Pseudouridine synthase n=1 Tax=Mixia osmundae (strain CBS 9802 / IAM 14324 / JCM 22182 / KY 12970) TaxID=764103 RepID=G7DWP8_MIXOS|nr:uncharacterized protein L969DRAFT_97569 [Mixia osmundae IAM 14324]KEI36226.1 hypothetical protein L969DRAFT_97569 [Mixia osmundae IAM 14324]GAA94995.1 hypothetical protein E5Q_01650 [Mixia osmundae IAM 14324]